MRTRRDQCWSSSCLPGEPALSYGRTYSRPSLRRAGSPLLSRSEAEWRPKAYTKVGPCLQMASEAVQLRDESLDALPPVDIAQALFFRRRRQHFEQARVGQVLA